MTMRLTIITEVSEQWIPFAMENVPVPSMP